VANTQLAGLSVQIIAGADRGALVVFLHGFGAAGDDLVPLAKVLRVPDSTWFAFPEAPLALPPPYGFGEARAWWLLDFDKLDRVVASGRPRDLSDEVPEALPEARARVVALLGELERELEVPAERTVLGGFSQGAMLACDVALHSDRPLAGLVLMSGNLLAAERWVPRMPARAGMPVFQSHGTEDPLLPLSGAERLRDELTQAGLTVDWLQFVGGHGIPPQVVEAVGGFLTRVLAEPA
jgi:phospholipase/carboxylesterase